MRRCSNSHCPYDLEAYSDHPQYKGLCLNCLDDERREEEMMRVEANYNEALARMEEQP